MLLHPLACTQLSKWHVTIFHANVHFKVCLTQYSKSVLTRMSEGRNQVLVLWGPSTQHGGPNFLDHCRCPDLGSDEVKLA